MTKKRPYSEFKSTLFGCPYKVAFGGIHGAMPQLFIDSDNKKVILNYDVSSYYPSLMIQNKYLSRNISNAKVFEDTFHRRLKAKAEGDKKTANALKLVLNTTYGASNNKYNDLYDPLMAHSVCISGQLYLLELAVSLGNAIKDFTLCQLNTDGIMIYIPRSDIETARSIVNEWSTRTGFGMEEDNIAQLRQRDVNNYCIRKSDGSIKAKGGVLSDWKGGSFKHSSLVVVCRALLYKLLDDKAIEDTIDECDDIFDFQMITKTGSTYEKCVHATGIGEHEVQRVNRVYASKNANLGTLYKVKSDRSRTKIPSCPEHAIIDNEGILTIDKIDKQWYIDLCNERLEQFYGRAKNARKRKERRETEKLSGQTILAF